MGKKLRTINLLEAGIRFYVAYCIFIYGINKYRQFDAPDLYWDVTIKNASLPELMWSFFGATQFYPIMIGCIQICGAILLLSNKTKLLACIILTPVFINIMVLDILYEIHILALINAIIYQTVLIWIMFRNRKIIKSVLQTLLLKSDHFTFKKSLVIPIGIAVVINYSIHYIYNGFN